MVADFQSIFNSPWQDYPHVICINIKHKLLDQSLDCLTLGICWKDLTASKNLACISLTWLSKLFPPAPPTSAVHVSISKCCVVCTNSRTSLHLSMKLLSDIKQTLFLAGHGESVQSSVVSRPLLLSEKLLLWWKILLVLGVRLSM